MADSERKLHINMPKLLPRRRRVADAVLTALMWAFYSYLWAPLISLVAWLLGFEFAYDVLVRAGGLELLKDVILFYGTTVTIIFIVVSGWSIINRSRFAHRNRRKAIQTVTEEEIREFCKDNIAHFKIPKYIRFVEEFPMTVTGKLQKFKMREEMIKLQKEK